MDWKELYPEPYDKNTTDPYTKTRIILMNGAEFEANWFSHQFHRHCADNELRRTLAVSRRAEKQQQMHLACLKPLNENLLETTISYEQLAVDLTAILAQRETDPYVIATLNFALLEDFDHLYRYADLMELEQGLKAEKLVGGYTEIMPGRPTISEHRHPLDCVGYHCDFTVAPLATRLHTSIITAAEQQTMNFYMNIAGFYGSDRGRALYQEIGLIEEQHVSEYGSLLDPNATWLENLLLHEYTECFLYYSCYEDETDPRIKKIWERHFMQEVAHLHIAEKLLKDYEKKEASQVIPDGEFPELLRFSPQKDYVRTVLQNTVHNSALREGFVPVSELPEDADFFTYQRRVNSNEESVPSHRVVADTIAEKTRDYRFEIAESPVPCLRDYKKDNTKLGRE
jgi:hypothetical protein